MSFLAHYEQYFDKTFADAKVLYLRDYRGKDRSRAEQSFAAVAPYVDHLKLIQIDNEMLETFKFDRYNGKGHFAKPAMAGTVNKDLAQIVTVITQACKVRRWLPSAPQILRVTGPVRRGHPMSWPEQDRLFDQLPTGFDIGVACFATNTGVRKEELFGLKWTDLFNVEQYDTFVFLLRETKNGKARAVICNSIARRCVDMERKWQAKHGESEYVFPRHRCPSSNGKVWADAWTRAKMPADPLIKRGIHNCRHTCGHRLRAAGVSDENRDAILGHNNANIRQRYSLPDIGVLNGQAELIIVRRDTLVLH